MGGESDEGGTETGFLGSAQRERLDWILIPRGFFPIHSFEKGWGTPRTRADPTRLPVLVIPRPMSVLWIL